MSGRTVVLTGGTSGIGQALARRLRQSGDRVIVVGRRAVEHSNSLVADLRNDHAPNQILHGLNRLGVERWDLLIHNAAAGWIGAIPEQPPANIVDILQVNTWSPIALTHRLLPLASSTARVVFVSSPVADWPSPDYAVYAASKAAMEAFARALRAERSISPSIQVIRPGATATEMLTAEDAASLNVSRKRFAQPDATAERIGNLLNGPPRWSGTDAASKLAAVMSRWGLKRWIRRPTRIPWPKDLFQPTNKRPPTALVTGAAEGIGRAISVRLTAEGFSIVGVDRNADALAETVRLIDSQGGTAVPILADLADRSSLDRLLGSLDEQTPFDVVIHNAGINRFGKFRDADLEGQKLLFAVNLVAPILLTRGLFARRLVKTGCRLGFVSSLSHFVGYPGSAVYAATKSGLAVFAESLSIAGREYEFSSTTVFPGPTRTRQASENSPDNTREHRRTDPDRLANAIVRAMMQRKSMLVYGIANRAAAELGRRFPRLTEKLMRKALLGKITTTSERREVE